MQPLTLKISDDTLRDGEQQAGIFFSYATKQKLAHLIAQTGVDGIDIMPCVCEQEAELAIAGATLVSGTFGGIGERAGNVITKSLAAEQERYFTANEVLELWENGVFK